MELLKEIYEKDLNIINNKKDVSYTLRKASRAIVFDENYKVALLYVSKNNYHKLPGGGIEEGEDIEKALGREIIEEVGVNAEIMGKIGCIIEYRDEISQLQISYCYFVKTVGGKKEPSFTLTEINDGFELKWVNINEAIRLLKNDKPDDYIGKFVQKRDSIFLQKGIDILNI